MNEKAAKDNQDMSFNVADLKSKDIQIEDLKKYDELYIIGHNNTDCDSYFSSYLLYKVFHHYNQMRIS